MNYVFYKFDSWDPEYQEEQVLIDYSFKFEIWKPSLFSIYPKGCIAFTLKIWWLMHHLHIFTNRNYGLFIVRDSNDNLIHRSVITPRYFRFPFMGKKDLQIGDTWTMPEYRGKGLASFAIQEIVKLHKKPGHRFWYVVEEDNIPSIKTVEKAGFVKYGAGVRKKRMGITLLGCFEIEERLL